MADEAALHKLPHEGLIDRALIDVWAFADALPLKYKTLSKIARQWVYQHSCDADVQVARAYVLDAERFRQGGRDSLNNATGALLQAAVIFYARAFDPASGHRSHLNITKKLDQRSRDFHALLIDLRHKSLAHFGPAGTEGGDSWSQDIPAIIIDRGTWQVMVASKRSLHRIGFAKDFLLHLETVGPLISESTERSKKRFEQEFEAAWQDDPEIEKLLADNMLNPKTLGGWTGPFLSGSRSGRDFRTLNDSVFKR